MGTMASMSRLVDGTTRKDTGGLLRGMTTFNRLNGAFAIDEVTKSVNDTSKTWANKREFALLVD
jgi:hypothetical protein